jgi:hypothetical protein
MSALIRFSNGRQAGIFRLRSFILLVAIVAVLSGPCSCPAQPVIELKVAFIYNFARFVEWPDTVFSNRQAHFVIGVQKPDALAEALKELAGKLVHGRPIKIVVVNRTEEIKSCQLVFLSRPANHRLIQDTLSNLPVLTITDEEADFQNLGAIINFIVVENRMRFEINLSAARRANLKVSSLLLRLARIVRD